ncbi:MAG: aminoacyl-tRNA deacylase, partial [Candidatus Nanohaloarchaea archaeon]
MRADEFLERNGVEYEKVVEHEPVKSCGEAAEVRGVDPSSIVKSLIVESDGEVFHVCIPGDRTLSEKKFGQKSSGGQVSSIRMVPPEKSEKITGQESGTVHPFSTDLPHVVDERILERDELSHTVGNEREGLIYSPEDFLSGLESLDCSVSVEDVVVTEQEDIDQLQKFVDGEDATFLAENGYRGLFLEMAKGFETRELVEAIRKLNRQDTSFGKQEVKELVERAENDTHMLKLAEKFAETG